MDRFNGGSSYGNSISRYDPGHSQKEIKGGSNVSIK